MKFKSLATAALAFAAILTSCNKDDLDGGTDGGTTTPAGPTLTVTPADTTVWKGDTISYNYTITSDKAIATLEVTTDSDSLMDTTISSFNGTYSVFGTLDYIIDSSVADGDVINLKLKATDEDGATYADSTSVVIRISELAGPKDSLTNEFTAALIWNLQGPYLGAWDLVANDSISSLSADSLKDMSNLTTFLDVQNDSLDGKWKAGWESKNGTMFVMANDFDYANATMQDAKAAYNAGTAATSVESVATDNVIIAKLRGGSDYVVIKITNVVHTDNDNKDKIEFSYKK